MLPDDLSKGDASYLGVLEPVKYKNGAGDGEDGALINRPEFQIFSLSILGGRRFIGQRILTVSILKIHFLLFLLSMQKIGRCAAKYEESSSSKH